MTFSPQLEERFAKMLTRYPEGRTRSAVVPMLIYAQDEVGAVTKEVIEEVAKRCEVTPLQVDEVVGYYSMLHRKPHGQIPRAGVHQHQLPCWWAAKNCMNTPRRSWASATRKSPRTACFRSKKSSAWARARGRRRWKSITIFIIT